MCECVEGYKEHITGRLKILADFAICLCNLKTCEFLKIFAKKSTSFSDTENLSITCIDVDECQLDYCDLNALCTNSIGSFDCSCDRGYTGDGIYGSEGCIGRL